MNVLNRYFYFEIYHRHYLRADPTATDYRGFKSQPLLKQHPVRDLVTFISHFEKNR